MADLMLMMMFVIKHYDGEHSCIMKTTRNRKIIDYIVANRFGDEISSMPSIRTNHLKALARRNLGVFVTNKVCRNARELVFKIFKKYFKEGFRILNNYAKEMKEINQGNTITVVFERRKLDDL